MDTTPLKPEEDDEEYFVGHDIYDEDDPDDYSFPHRMLRSVKMEEKNGRDS